LFDRIQNVNLCSCVDHLFIKVYEYFIKLYCRYLAAFWLVKRRTDDSEKLAFLVMSYVFNLILKTRSGTIG